MNPYPAIQTESTAASARKAFTLIELLVVVAIIAVLMAVLLPSLASARRQSKELKCLANVGQISKTLLVYAQEFNDTLPYGFISGKSDWSLTIKGYLIGKEAANYATYGSTGAGLTNAILICPLAAYQGGSLHYSAHPIMMPSVSDISNSKKPYKVTRARRNSDIMMLADANQVLPPDGGGSSSATLSHLDGWSAPNYLSETDSWYYSESLNDNENAIYAGTNNDGPYIGGLLRWRHGNNDKLSVGYLDGHAAVARKGTKDLCKKNIRPD